MHMSSLIGCQGGSGRGLAGYPRRVWEQLTEHLLFLVCKGILYIHQIVSLPIWHH